MRAPALAAVGIAAYVVFLAATLPGSVVLASAQRAGAASFEVRESSGTLWRGSAKLTVNTPGGPLALERLDWHWLPAHLLTGRLALDITMAAPGFDAHGVGARTLGGWEARGLEARGDAAKVALLLPWLATWRPEGSVAITSARLDTDGVEVRGTARIEWRGAAVAISGVKPLGTYRADVEAQGHAGRVALTTVSGPLRITGQGTLTPPAALAFTGEARADPESARALEPLLDLLGPARADGARALQWRAP
jgi:general secretion pathway protein N